MVRPICSDAACERSIVRYRDGAGYCLFHPDSQPPVLDPKTGKPISTTPPARRKPKKADEPAPYRAPGRVVEVPTPRPAPAPAPRPPRAPAVVEQPPADGVCPREGCSRPWRHRGWHTQPKPEKPPRVVRAPRPVAQRPADGLCTVEGCVRAWRHKGAHTTPLDVDDAVRRYLGGEGLFELAASLHIGHKRLRDALTSAGVTIRGRGEVIGRRGPEPRPIDVEECKRLYAGGMDSREISRHLGVKARRVLRRKAREARPDVVDLAEVGSRDLLAELTRRVSS